MSAPNSRFVRACRCEPVDVTPIWLMRQAGRYMAEYRAVRKKHSILEICKTPEIAAEVTITAAEKLDVDAAIIFADLLLPLEVMGLPFRFEAGEGPVVERPLRTKKDVDALETHRAAELGYVAESIRKVVRHFGEKLPVIGFCGAPFTLASYMIEGGGSRNYVHTKRLMYTDAAAWQQLMRKLVQVLAAYAADQVRAGADVLQIFDSWVGCLSMEDYREYVLPFARELVQALQQNGVPVIYFGTDTATLLPSMKETGADVIGVDWRIPLDQAWSSLDHRGAVQGNLDPVLLFADKSELRKRADAILRQAGGRPGHIFNLGHGILPETPVDNVRALVDFVRELSAKYSAGMSPKDVATAQEGVEGAVR
ncbi:MAG TPA: uroporphyrinogen decarboxylase [Candidatus Angelobacter sp.]|nr:uroporphyrinogen decarboxylase [Candidatus Angelobacter sp.]